MTKKNNISNKGYLKNSNRAALIYFLRDRFSLPREHCIVNSIISFRETFDKKKKIVVLDRDYIRWLREKDIKFEKIMIPTAMYKKHPKSNPGTHVLLEIMDYPQEPFLELWRKRVTHSIQEAGLNKNLAHLLGYIVPPTLSLKLKENYFLDDLLDVVCEHFYSKNIYNYTVRPKQSEYLFVRDYYEAVVKYTRAHIKIWYKKKMSEESVVEEIRDVFCRGLVGYIKYHSSMCESHTMEDYLTMLEGDEDLFISELRSEYEGKDYEATEYINLYVPQNQHC